MVKDDRRMRGYEVLVEGGMRRLIAQRAWRAMEADAARFATRSTISCRKLIGQICKRCGTCST